MNKVKITASNHHHDGKLVEPGTVIEVDDIDRDIIINANAGELVAETPTADETAAVGEEAK